MTSRTLLFDYGGTLDSGARHWNYVLLDGYRQAATDIPALRHVEGELWRQAYVHGERTLAREPHISPEDDFHTLLLKKVYIELAYLREMGLPLSDRETKLAATHIADCSNEVARSHTAAARSLLETLRARGHRLALVTNFYGNIRSVLQSYHLLDLFPTVIESAVVGVRKPDPAIWQMALDATHAAPDQCIAIGDSYTKDIVPAHTLHIPGIWFKGEEWEEKNYDKSLPTHTITALEQLLPLLP